MRYYLNDYGLYLSWAFVLIIGLIAGAFMFNMYLKNTESVTEGMEALQLEYYRGMYEFCTSVTKLLSPQTPDSDTILVCRDSIRGAISVDRFGIQEPGWENGYWTGLSD